MHNILLTVLLITYNHREYIEKAIKSILEQKTNFNFIVKILDDCSNDGTSEIVEKYAKQYPQQIKHVLREKNYGIVDNIYQGLTSINTRYFAELEGDDYWCNTNKLQIAVDALENNVDCVMFAHNTKIFKSNRWVENIIDNNGKSNKHCDTKFKLGYYLKPPYLHFSSRVYKNIFDFNTIDKHVAAYDIGIYYLYLEKGYCYYHDEIMSVYNTNNTSYYYTKSPSKREEIDYLVINKLNKFFDYKYNKIMMEFIHDQQLFKNIQEVFGMKAAWDMYLDIKLIHDKTNNDKNYNNFLLYKLIHLANKIRGKLKIRTRFKSFLFWLNNITKKVKNEKIDLLIVDDVFPHPLSPFRYTEYTEYLKHFKSIKIISNGMSLGCIKDNKNLKSIISEYIKKFPLFHNKVESYSSKNSYDAKLIYVNFLGNVIQFDIGYSFKVPFIVNLYPGGMLQVCNTKTDNYLRKYLNSSYCKKVIVTQDYVYNYLIENKLCQKEKIELIFGVVTPLNLLETKLENKERYGFQKESLDICFVSHKYTEKGIDKGYDKFIEVAHKLASRYNNINFHVVGPFNEGDIDTSKITHRINFYGPQNTEWFKNFYKNKDIIISPNIPFVLSPGGFDGFPTASVTEAGLNEVAMFVTDELSMNNSRFIDGEEIILIKPDVESIIDKIEYYLKHPDQLKSISELGTMKIKDLYSYEKQIFSRISIIQNELNHLKN